MGPTGADPLERRDAAAVQHQALTHQRLVALFIAAVLLFNFPLLAMWDGQAQLWGLPLFPLALFAIWALLIAALALVLERQPE